MDSLMSQSLWCDTDFLQVLLHHYVLGHDMCLAHIQVLQHLLRTVKLKVTTLVTVELLQYSEVAEAVGNKGFCHCRTLFKILLAPRYPPDCLFTLEFGWYILHFVPGENCMSYF
jgi:hypothetical protein